MVWPPIIFLGNNSMIQSLFGNYSTDDGLVIQSTHWSMLRVVHIYPSNFTQDSSPSHSEWITNFITFIPISPWASSTITHTVVIIANDLSGSQAPCILSVLYCLVVPPINLTGGRFTTVTGLSASKLYFENRSTGWWPAPSFTIDECGDKDTSVDAFYTSLFLHNYVDFLYRDRIS